MYIFKCVRTKTNLYVGSDASTLLKYGRAQTRTGDFLQESGWFICPKNFVLNVPKCLTKWTKSQLTVAAGIDCRNLSDLDPLSV